MFFVSEEMNLLSIYKDEYCFAEKFNIMAKDFYQGLFTLHSSSILFLVASNKVIIVPPILTKIYKISIANKKIKHA